MISATLSQQNFQLFVEGGLGHGVHMAEFLDSSN